MALHGWLDNANSFDPLLSELDYAGEVYALDLPGHGLSDHRPPGIPYYFWDSAVDLGDALAALRLDEFLLLGHSLGGGLSSVLSAIFAPRVKAAIFIEALGPFVSDPKELVAGFRAFLKARSDMDTKKKPLYPDAATAASARMTVGGISRSAVEKLCARGLVEVPGGVTWRTDSRLRLPSLLRLTEAHVSSYLAEILCPVLLVRATESIFSTLPQLEARKAVVKKLTEVVLPGNHHLHMDIPKEVAQHITSFLNKAL